MGHVLRHTNELLYSTIEGMINDKKNLGQSNLLQKIVLDTELTSYIELKKLTCDRVEDLWKISKKL